MRGDGVGLVFWRLQFGAGLLDAEVDRHELYRLPSPRHDAERSSQGTSRHVISDRPGSHRLRHRHLLPARFSVKLAVLVVVRFRLRVAERRENCRQG